MAHGYDSPKVALFLAPFSAVYFVLHEKAKSSLDTPTSRVVVVVHKCVREGWYVYNVWSSSDRQGSRKTILEVRESKCGNIVIDTVLNKEPVALKKRKKKKGK